MCVIRARSAEFAEAVATDSAVLKGLKANESQEEVASRKAAVLAGRKRKILDFLPRGNTKRLPPVEASKEDAPLGGGGGGGGKEMTEEEKEMLAILKGISTSESNKFQGGGSGGEGDITGNAPRQKVKNPRMIKEIAQARLQTFEMSG